MRLEPDFTDLISPEKTINHIESLKKESEPVSHTEILNKLLNQVEKVDFEKIAFSNLEQMKNDLSLKISANISTDERKKLSRKLEQLEDLQLREKHFLIITIENVLQLAERYRWGLCKNDDFIYLYNGTYWQQIDKEEFQKFLGEAAEKMGVAKFSARYYQFREKLFKQFLATAYLPTPESDKDTVLINLKNGTFEITKTGTELRPFDRSDFITYQLPFEYNPKATAPIFTAFLNRVLPDKDSQQVLAEYLGYIFIKHGSRLKLEAALILYGSGANGKSVFFEIVNAMLGSENVSSYSLQELTDNTGYYRAMVANKLVNYASEINGKLEVNYFKRMVSGEPVPARLPYGKPMQLKQYAKFIFNCNELPKDVEHTNAFFRRWVIIPFEVTIPKDEQDSELHNKIIDKELSGVFNWVLEGLHRLLKQKKFTKSIAVQKAVEQYRLESDSVQMYLTDFEYTTSATEESKLKDLFSEYRTYCIESGFRACSLKTFSDRLKNLGFVAERKSYGMAVNAVKNNFY
ncbi:DNA primase [Chryseobacterium lacus]|uniref:DNA primase n=1 Tax=Chryseobacterium lacus TaxID=2058346 RepID=A0A368MX82_9FLAO|nr:DNA primase family protein [Chryseobacterium lacus]RCU42453.1 DNA primase [Chryseobacterium lacus]RST27015.1 DNA primase [Chryseobacterium lacus]